MIRIKMKKDTRKFLYQILEFPDYYISRAGEVWSLKRKIFVRIKAVQGSTKYWQASFNGVTKSIHRLLAKAFIPNFSNKPCVNHIDGNRSNNALDNLEWVSYSENNYHAYKAGLANSDYRKKKIQKICLNTNQVLDKYDSLLEAAALNQIQFKNISKVCKGERCSAGGYSWRYVNEF